MKYQSLFSVKTKKNISNQNVVSEIFSQHAYHCHSDNQIFI